MIFIFCVKTVFTASLHCVIMVGKKAIGSEPQQISALIFVEQTVTVHTVLFYE